MLISDDFVLKISDFGLARKLYSGIYEKNRNKKVSLYYSVSFLNHNCLESSADSLDGSREHGRIEVFISE